VQDEAQVGVAALSPDGSVVAVGDSQFRLIRWDAIGKKMIGNGLPMGTVIRAVRFSHDGKYLAATAGNIGKGSVAVFRTPTPLSGTPEQLLAWAQFTSGKQFRPDGTIEKIDESSKKKIEEEMNRLGGPPTR